MVYKKLECFGAELYVILEYSSGFSEQITINAVRPNNEHCASQQFARYEERSWFKVTGYMDNLSTIEKGIIRGVLIDLGRVMGDLRRFICVHDLM